MNDQGVALIDIRELERKAIERYSDCPTQIAIVRHADKEEDSDLHCVIAATSRQEDTLPVQRNFLVPKQEMVTVRDAKYGVFSVIRVFNKEDRGEYALFTSVHSRLGFLHHLAGLPFTLPTPKETVA